MPTHGERGGVYIKREQHEVSFHSLRQTATFLLKAAGVKQALSSARRFPS
jgi:hypothetical protein